MIKNWIILCVTLMAWSAYAQPSTSAWESNIALNYSFMDWKWNSSIAHRSINPTSGNSHLAFIEANQFATRKILSDMNLSLGYKYRKLDRRELNSGREQRLTQQLAYTHLHTRIRLMSRFRSEQRFRDSGFEHRYRYRLSADIPLNGEKLDEGEFFTILSSELLFDRSDGQSGFDHRFSAGLGYVFSAFIKIQLDYTLRSENLTTTVDQVHFVTTSLILNLAR